MKRILLATVATFALPMLAMAQSNDSMSNSTTTTPSTMSSGTGNDATAGGMSATGSGTMSKLSMQDTHFIKTAAISGMAEVNDGKLAQSMGSADVQKVGEQMVTDHTKANSQLMALANEKGATPPMQVDAKHAAITSSLQKLSGSSFDKRYLSTELQGHEMTIAAFKTEASTGSDPGLKSFASSTLPILEQHLSMIKAAMK